MNVGPSYWDVMSCLTPCFYVHTSCLCPGYMGLPLFGVFTFKAFIYSQRSFRNIHDFSADYTYIHLLSPSLACPFAQLSAYQLICVCCKILNSLILQSVLDWEIWTPNKNNVSAWLPCPFHFSGSPCKSKCQSLEWTFRSWVFAGRKLQYSSNKDDILQAHEKPCHLEIRH